MLSNKTRKILLDMGYQAKDLPQINDAKRRCNYTLYDEGNPEDGRKISAAEAKAIVGDFSFWSGLGRAAFHRTAKRTENDGSKSVLFEVRWGKEDA